MLCIPKEVGAECSELANQAAQGLREGKEALAVKGTSKSPLWTKCVCDSS